MRLTLTQIHSIQKIEAPIIRVLSADQTNFKIAKKLISLLRMTVAQEQIGTLHFEQHTPNS